MRRQLLPGILMMVVLTVLLGFVYPLVVTGDRASRDLGPGRTARWSR